MDPTMQSPIQYGNPFSRGQKITMPSGPHHYQTKSWVGNVRQGNTPHAAFESLKRHAIPFQGDQVSADGAVMNVLGLGPIRQHVNDDLLSIVNTTMPGHVLYPGNVFRSIRQKGDDLYVVTEGYGTGVLPVWNEKGAGIWSWPDHMVRHDLNPYPQLGYPMDEMNQPTGMGAAVNTKAQPFPSPQPADRPEQKVPLPIFFAPY